MGKVSFEQGDKIKQIIQERVGSNRNDEQYGAKEATIEIIKLIEEEICVG